MPDEVKQGIRLRVTREGITVDASKAEVLLSSWTWEQIDAYRKSIEQREERCGSATP
jgi:hypothetical protein